MFDHVSLPCSDLLVSRKFYDAIFSALGFVRVWTKDTACGYGSPGGEDQFAIKLQKIINTPGAGFHIAFSCPSREALDAFYKAALLNGGRDKGSPGLRPHYGPSYYAAFVLDPDGHHLEAVCHR